MPDHASPATSLRPADLRPGQVWRDPRTPGLHLRAFTSRSVWYLYYRLKDGRERRPKLGDARSLTLPQAREIARQALAAVAIGPRPSPAPPAAASARCRTNCGRSVVEILAGISAAPEEAPQPVERPDLLDPAHPDQDRRAAGRRRHPRQHLGPAFPMLRPSPRP
ncbi:MAG: Arm DNA-binding domain-containing protein [Pseudomonadota bacterium]